MPEVIRAAAPLIARYDLLLCDIWGVVHNGQSAYTEALHALEQARAAGKTVIMISNAPRPGSEVKKQLANIYKVPASCYDDIIASGDVTREELKKRPGVKLFHLGPERDLPNYENLDVKLVSLEEAELIVCTGPFNDEIETPSDYEDMFEQTVKRGLLFLCANPDIVVERGDKLVWCAGALAQVYERFGGKTLYAGKPHPAVYRDVFELAARLRGKPVSKSKALAIGDGVKTDLKGAVLEGIDCLFVAGGIHSNDLGLDRGTQPDAARFAEVFDEAGGLPVAVTHRLVW
jgi:HAD superfamily hydrolase (TIGR01459 family)